MSRFNEFNEALGLLNRAEFKIFGSFLEVTLKSAKDWNNLKRVVMANISMQTDRTVCFMTADGSMKIWWTAGVNHNPYGPAILIDTPEEYFERHTDINGFMHREGGPAQIKRKEDGTYREEWGVHPGTQERTDGGPALIAVEPPSLIITWEDWAKSRHYINKQRYDKNTPVQVGHKRIKQWVIGGRPKRTKGKPTKIVEEAFGKVIEITPALVPRVTSYADRRIYNWERDDGVLHRTDGPATITLYNVCREKLGAQKVNMTWTNWSGQWFYEGKAINPGQWFRENNVDLVTTPPIEGSAFVKPDDEFCFLTDFVGRET